MAELYAQLIRDGKKTIDEIPNSLKTRVLEILTATGDWEENI